MMRSLFLGTALSLVAVAGATAADLGVRAPVWSWTGFYIGGNAGGHWSRISSSTTADPTGFGAAGAAAIDAATPGVLTPAGFIGGAQAGYSMQVANWVWGFEYDVDWLNHKSSRSVTNFAVINPADVFSSSVSNSYLATFRGRVGSTFDRALFYVTGGLALTNPKLTDSFGAFGNTSIAFADINTTRAGWTVGGGVEYGLSPSISAKLEYLHADFGRLDRSFDSLIPPCSACAAGSDITVHHNYTEDVVRAGLNFRIGAPIVTRY